MPSNIDIFITNLPQLGNIHFMIFSYGKKKATKAIIKFAKDKDNNYSSKLFKVMVINHFLYGALFCIRDTSALQAIQL